MKMEDIRRMPASKVWRVTELARKLDLRPEEEFKLKKLFGEFVTEHEFSANVELPARFR